MNHFSKKDLAREMGVSRASLYYQPKLPQKDWTLKTQIEQVLHIFPSYGYKRIAIHLGVNKKRINRVMRLFGIKPYRRRVKKPRKKRDENNEPMPYPNLLLESDSFPSQVNTVWASDFTYVPYKQRFIYLATVIDLFSRTIVGFNLLTSHNVDLVKEALIYALINHPKPDILHSDQGREYTAKEYVNLIKSVNVKISMSRKKSPWENGYQESFYSQFKLDLGDPNRFSSLGELAYNIYRQVHVYNQLRIHGELKMPLVEYAKRHQLGGQNT